MNLTRPAAALIAAFCLAGCTPGAGGPASPARTASPAAAAAPSADTPAAALRQALDGLLAELPYLLSALAGAGLGGRDADFKALGVAVDSSSNDLVAVFTSAYGRDPGAQFSGLWKKRVQALVDYLVALAGKNPDKQAAARRALDQSSSDLAGFLGSVTRAGALDSLLADQAKGQLAALDDLAGGSPARQYEDLRLAGARGAALGDALALATARNLPQRYPGDPSSPAAGLRVRLDLLLREHTLLVLAGSGAATALSANSGDLASLLEGYLGAGFSTPWQRQVQLFSEYGQALAAKDRAKRDAAAQGLQQWSRDLAAWLNSVAGLPVDPVAALLRDHALAVVLVFDEEAGGDPLHAAQDLRAAVLQVRSLADATANATVRRFPSRFAAPGSS